MSVQDSVNTYLDERLNSLKDTNTAALEALLAEETTRYEQLEQKLEEVKEHAKYTLDHALHKTLSDKSSLDHLYIALTTTKSNVAQVCREHPFNANDNNNSNMSNNNNNISDSAKFIHTLGDMEQRLRILDSATSYIKTLLVMSHLWQECLTAVTSSHLEAVQRYNQLRRFAQLVCTQTSVKSGSFKDLGTYISKCQAELWNTLNVIFAKDLQHSLQALNWPTAIHPPYGPQVKSKLEALEKSFRHLLLLEPPSGTTPSITAPMRLLLDPIALRFRFHFEGSRPTNRLDKPEWYLKHTKSQISTHIPFIMTVIQPIVDDVLSDDHHHHHISAKDYFIEGLLTDVVRKVTCSAPKLLSQPNWLSHTIHELLQFDQFLHDDFGFAPVTDTLVDEGRVSNVILKNVQCFDAWFKAEKQFAQARYDEIVSDNQIFELFEESERVTEEEASTVEATHSSMKLIHLWESVTDSYRLLPSDRQKFQFFVHIQLSLLGQYHYRIASTVDSFEARSLIRSVQVPGALPDAVTGVITANESDGSLAALKRLYRWWTSAQKMIEAIRDWEEDEFFLDLNYHVEQEQEIIIDARDELIRENKVCYVVDPTSSSPNKSIFSDIGAAFEQLVDRIQKICVRIVVKEWAVDAKAYSKRDVWWQAMNEVNSPLEVSDSLYQSLRNLWISCHYLQKVYPQISFFTMYKHISLGVEDWYWQNIIKKNQFSSYGIEQLDADLRLGLWKIGRRLVSKPENYTRRLKEALQLFTMPVASSSSSSSSSSPSSTEVHCDHLMKLLSNPDQHSEVQATLDKLGIETLSNGEIRVVLRRRNDLLNSWN